MTIIICQLVWLRRSVSRNHYSLSRRRPVKAIITRENMFRPAKTCKPVISRVLRKTVILVALPVLVAACMAPTEPIAPQSSFAMYGAIVSSPAETGWSIAQKSEFKIVFGKRGPSEGETTIAQSALFRTPENLSPAQFLPYMKDYRTKNNMGENPNRFKIISKRHDSVKFQGRNCVRYMEILQDLKPVSSAVGPQFQRQMGYMCIDPGIGFVGVEMGYSNRSSEREITGAFRSSAKQFISGIKLQPLPLE